MPQRDILLKLTQYASPETVIRKKDDGKLWVYYDDKLIVELGKRKSIDNVFVHPEDGFKHGRCKMIKKNGDRCGNGVRRGWTVCWKHGAGKESNPAGRPVTVGRYSKFLPHGLLDNYAAAMSDPEYLSLRDELALIEARMGELLTRLDTSQSANAWANVRNAYLQMRKCETEDDMLDVEGMLEEALAGHDAELTVWNSLSDLIATRRRLADTERRRIVDAQQYLNYQEANALIAAVMDAVLTNVSDPQARSAISERLRQFAVSR